MQRRFLRKEANFDKWLLGALCHGMHSKDGEAAVRRILGVLSLAKKYGAATVDDACAAVLEMGSCSA